ncbi:hypothetical protein B0T18DRAFT_137788 [Schizothecium vesticola]|uniref:J domain-containing protein n=1 Tax=Schizothecium vesticola TaxID=314040 RepID=A0AA40K4P9_9PEZI|nr:hypothetical protein B0T18DRAFT_137788 [Schizothecium vesticola]
MPVEITDDYYAVLEINQAAKDDAIKASYKRLARVRHPDKDAKNPNATVVFQLLQAAYSTLIDPVTRRDYDTRCYPIIRLKSQAKPTTSGGPSTSTPPAFPPDPTPSAADQAELNRYKTLIASLEKSIIELQSQKAQQESFRMEAARNLAKCQAALKRIQEEAEKDAKELAAKTGWFKFWYGAAETEAQKEARQRRENERRTGKIVREVEEKRLNTKIDEIMATIGSWEFRLMQARRQKATAVDQEKAVQQRITLAAAKKWREKMQESEAKARAQQAEARKKREEETRRKQEEMRRTAEEEIKRRDELKKQWQKEQAKRDREEAIRRYEERARREEEEEIRRRQEEIKRKQQNARRWAEEAAKRQEVGEKAAREAEERDLKIQREILEASARVAKAEMEKANASNTAEPSGSGAQGSADRGRGRGRGRGGRGQGRGSFSRQSGTRAAGTASASAAACQHKGWWEKIPGDQKCSRCLTRRGAFRCRECSTTACMVCRDHLRGSITGDR